MAESREKSNPSITLSRLLELAKHADVIGAKKYAEAYRLVANRLRAIEEAEPGYES